MASITFSAAKARYANLLTYNAADIGSVIQEAVDRAYEMGRFRGMSEEVLLDDTYYVEDADNQCVYADFSLTNYNGAIGFRTESGGWGIVDQIALYRDGVNSGDLSVVDYGEVDVNGTIKRRYRLPIGSKIPSYDIWALLKKMGPTLTDPDIVPIKSQGALKSAILAIAYENVNDVERAKINWDKFIYLMNEEEKQFNGIRQYNIGIVSSMRRKPTQFM